jgi:integrase/recombinase XerD
MEPRDIPGARVYKRERSTIWQITFKTKDGQQLRKSSGEVDEGAAWAELGRQYLLTKELSFKDVVLDFFTTRRDLKASTLHGYKNSLRVLDLEFRNTTLNQISTNDLKKFVAKRRTKVSDAATRRDLAFLSSLFTHAQRCLPNAPETNVVRQFDKKHLKENKRDRWLTRQEFERLESACIEEVHRMVVTTAVYTGLRHSEMRHLLKKHVHFENETIQLPGEITKNGKPRTVPILPEFRDQFEAFCSRTLGESVFSHFCNERKSFVPFSTFQNFFRLARTRAGLKDVTIHDLRHTFASWWVQSGGDMYVLKDILGHSSMQMVERYGHLDAEATHRAAMKISEHTFGTLGRKSKHTPKRSLKK